ncbi:MAG: hypothetical protein UX49_C0047G0002 [Candidatus Wolfebacteria bacterium GW2011_GWC2_46_275]|uniref:Permease n=1 Tax=Candidatus Wolfebacteria bacterium GW2011_GWB1_47_1 TaxID=1619007 RepID=A0A0G4ASH6_9BACT|nr:MAG: hypothetical protein UX70_C0001G1014 [Candidatus Wolfebacteria bacterium GW2011_GWB1_47_1]KKU34435.1 MAG: hypothetical protein UX49_C0047G0002 [Candidatus Wolfebacteria bacterium GW2011_GWC2_46_275]KKU41483.1 MAG: hypothetical protein UX58_C0008G0049 [Candidatus Wolfebacteria bacterium GW2011_GWB2_46_69]KKU53577.1 MAG: hypothetical protein UX76_C0013G0005 [Candidatus Wolfebacteria bacterium GW2011_GWC1_47_103]KKU58808.1 MAG: hypothetical protein UX83_C0011G0020 [Candidatus Wolfebacteria
MLNSKNVTKEKLQHNFFFFLLAIMTIAGLFLLSPYADVFFVAIMFAILFKPMHRGILSAFRGRKTLSALVATLTVLLVVLIPLSFFGFQIFEEAKDLYIVIANSDLQTNGAANIGNALQRYAPQLAPALSADIGQYIVKGLQWVVTNLSTVFSSAVAIVVNFLLILFTLFFLFRDESVFRKTILALSPLEDAHNEELLNKVELAIASVTKGTLIVSLLQGVLTGIGFAVVGIPNPVLWASIAAFAAMIPAVGTGLVIVPAVAFLFVTGHVVLATVLAIWGFGIVGTVDNVVRPALIGKGINIHPLLILFSALGGLNFFGIIGFFVGPVVLAVLFALFEMYPKIVQNHEGE